MASAVVIFSLFYAVFALCFVTQSKEFVAAGLSTENILLTIGWLGPSRGGVDGEQLRIVRYHILLTAGSIVLHSLWPLGYLLGYFSLSSGDENDLWWIEHSISLLSLTLPTCAIAAVIYWSLDDWSNHPFVRILRIYSDGHPWTEVADSIDEEFRRVDKLNIRTSPVSQVFVTDNWLISIGSWPWSLHVAHQSDVVLDVIESDHHPLATNGDVGGTQYLVVRVNNRKPGAPSFHFRMNSLDYQNLREKIQGPILNARNIQIYKSTSERFVDAFRACVLENPRVSTPDVPDNCIGCLVSVADVKLQRRCGSLETDENKCVTCYCRPMWCLSCLGKWFASRQNQKEPETWLGSKCPCPTCRSKFCVLDVCLIENETEVSGPTE